MPHQIPWLIFFLPLISFAVISFIIRPFLPSRFKWAGYVTILLFTAAFGLSVWTLVEVINSTPRVLHMPSYEWLTVGNLKVELGMHVDSLTAVMLIVVTLVSTLIQVYSQGYMHGDPGYARYYAFMSLFTASMLGLVLADNLLMLYVFWEGVGLCSYLLIGFWFQRPAAAAAAKKAFIVTRLGDFGFLSAILFIYFKTAGLEGGPTFNIEALHEYAIAGLISGWALTWLALGVFAGAVGKSAQFPLHTWLPDAMEGPTPVSALIHAATMVAAGVYLVARLFPVFEASGTAIMTVAVIGGITAVFAASMGLVMNDIKRVLAYSTVSQLGYMMLALGLGGYVAGVFHLMNHAFFKALLFLGAGSVSHAVGGHFDIRRMGGLRKVMPWTFATFLIASLSIAGIPPLSGFWSKDEILVTAWDGHRYGFFFLALGGAFMTAFYMFRLMFITFGGTYRGELAEASGHDSHSGHGHGGPHESPWVMVFPLVALSVLAVISGFANPPSFMGWLGIPKHWMSTFLETPVIEEVLGGQESSFSWGVAGVGTLVALSGIFCAYAVYSAKWITADSLGRVFRPLYVLFSRKYYFDELYEGVIVRRGLYRFLSYATDLFDRYIIDGIVDRAGALVSGSGLRGIRRGAAQVMSRLETGQVQAYGLGLSLGVLLIVAGFLIFGRYT